MAIPFIDRKTVFDSISATETVELHNLFRGGHFASTILLEVVGSSSQDWTLAIQGRVTENGTYTPIDYQQIWETGNVALGPGTLTITDTTTRFYIVPNTPQFVQLVATRTAGNLTVYASMSSEPFSTWGGSVLGGRGTSATPSDIGANNRVDANFDLKGRLGVWIVGKDSGNFATPTAPADAVSTGTARFPTGAVLFGLAPDGAIDRVRTLGDTAGAGLGVLAVGTRTPGSSEVVTVRNRINNSASAAEVVDPTSGTKIRILSVAILCGGATAGIAEVYFAAGANITSTAGKEIAYSRFDDTVTSIFHSWPDGAGPVGAADDVLTFRLAGAVSQDVDLIAVYREE